LSHGRCSLAARFAQVVPFVAGGKLALWA